MLSFLWASVCQMIWIIANVTSAYIVGSDLYGCWRFYIALGFVILIHAWRFAQVRMFVMRRGRITILETTLVVCVTFVCSSLYTRGSSAMFAKRNFSFVLFISGISARFRFEIFCQNDPFCFSSVRKKTIFVSQLCLSCAVFLSDLRKKVRQDRVVLCAG